MSLRFDLTGNVFGKLRVMSLHGSHNNRKTWLCYCECGEEAVVTTLNLRSGITQSCGCLVAEGIRKRCTTHGQSKRGHRTAEYNIWTIMIKRCTNTKNEKYPDYGGRGICVCLRWLESFENFFADMGKRPHPDLSIERKNNDGNYEPDNCIWGTDEEQSRNKRNNRWLEYNGERHILMDWAKKWNVNTSTVSGHLSRGKSFEDVYKFYENKKAA